MGTRNEHLIKFLNQVVPALLKFLIISANHADPDKMLHSAASQLGISVFQHTLQELPYQVYQGLKN